MTPATDWKETQNPNESVLFEQLAAQLAGLQAEVGRKTGTVRRGLHAKANLIARAKFEVLDAVPAHLKVGLFGAPHTYDAVVRFSNGSPSPQPDEQPDVRGLAVKLLGVDGPKLIPGLEKARTQDFLAILTPSMPFHTPADFVWFVMNAGSPLSLVPKAIMRLGWGRAVSLLKRLQKSVKEPRYALHTNRYFSALPIRFGPYAAKFSWRPLGAMATRSVSDDLGAELATRLEHEPVQWAFDVQLFADEISTPIEDPTVEWQTPWVQLGVLTLPPQSVQSPPGQQLVAWGEGLSFDPWHAQVELRPLGAMMRARNVAYRVSTQARKASSEPEALP